MKFRIFILIVLLQSFCFPQRQISPEAKVFSKTKNAVCTVFGKAGHGSGFLYDSGGLIITNDHVLGDNPGRHLSVKFNDSEKYYAKVVKRNKNKDIAIIGINPSIIKDISPLKLAAESDTMVYEGERVIAIGSPLNQSKILTSGIISKIEKKVLIHDVNINPGNSGGPLINMNGEVIGINTFGDFTNRGPGIYGSVIITEAKETIDLSKNIDLNNMSTELLPTIPQDQFPRKGLELGINEKYPKSVYKINGMKFEIFFYTPPQIYAGQKSKEKKLAEKRDNKTGEPNRYDLFSDLYDWGTSTGRHQPVVTMVVNPKIGQTAASAVGNVLLAGISGYAGTAYYGNETYEFKADVKDVSVKKGNKEILPYTSSYQYTTLDFTNIGYYGRSQGEDMAQQAILKLPIEAFLPNEVSGKFESLTLSVKNYKDDKLEFITIPMNTIYKISSDFREYTGNYLGKQLYKPPPSGCS